MNLLVDPTDIINFKRNRAELELFWLFCGVVAGKKATTQARLLAMFLRYLPGNTPFSKLHSVRYRKKELMTRLRESGLGQYNRLAGFMLDSLELPNLRKATLNDLMRVRGVGPKTARMFLMFTRPDQQYAALDTHLLKHLKAHGHKVPKATPAEGPTYRRLEAAFLDMVKQSGMTVAEYDLKVWRQYAT